MMDMEKGVACSSISTCDYRWSNTSLLVAGSLLKNFLKLVDSFRVLYMCYEKFPCRRLDLGSTG